ncbi:hypothetical protein [Actinomadura sp. 9N215]|uniref:hypothetical protein n=1 Tax=Actinomadura sp. 9N215 TaxID=3375150 RepID=UPI0037ABC426
MSRERAKGTAAETAIVTHLQRHGFPHAERRAGAGRLDRGDIAGIVGVVIEVKAHARTELAAWVDETRRETVNGKADYGAVWHKRRGKGDPADWFVTLDGDTFTRLLRNALGID